MMKRLRIHKCLLALVLIAFCCQTGQGKVTPGPLQVIGDVQILKPLQARADYVSPRVTGVAWSDTTLWLLDSNSAADGAASVQRFSFAKKEFLNQFDTVIHAGVEHKLVYPVAVAAAEDAIWLADCDTGYLYHVDSVGGEQAYAAVMRATGEEAGQAIGDLALALDGGVYAICGTSGTLMLATRTGSVRTFELDELVGAEGIGCRTDKSGNRSLLAAMPYNGSILEIALASDGAPSGVTVIARDLCEPVDVDVLEDGAVVALESSGRLVGISNGGRSFIVTDLAKTVPGESVSAYRISFSTDAGKGYIAVSDAANGCVYVLPSTKGSR